MTTDTGTKREIWTHRIGGAYPAVVTVYDDGSFEADGYVAKVKQIRLLAKEVARLHGLLHGSEVEK
jgi:hypothetical protein